MDIPSPELILIKTSEFLSARSTSPVTQLRLGFFASTSNPMSHSSVMLRPWESSNLQRLCPAHARFDCRNLQKSNKTLYASTSMQNRENAAVIVLISQGTFLPQLWSLGDLSLKIAQTQRQNDVCDDFPYFCEKFGHHENRRICDVWN